MKVTDFMPEFTQALRAQLEEDDRRWGDTWLERSRSGQEARAFAVFDRYWVEYVYENRPIPWLKIAGEALIAWIRVNHPEYFKK